MNKHSILVHGRPEVPDTLIHLNHRETAPPTCQMTATIVGLRVTMSLTQTGPSSHAGSGMFDKLPGPAGADVQQKTDGLIYSIRKKHTISLLYAHVHISTNLSSVVPLFVQAS